MTLPSDLTHVTTAQLDGGIMGGQRDKGRAKFKDFVRYAWPVVEPAHLFVPNWHIDAIADHLQAVAEGQIKRLLINVPPGHAKSLIVSVLWPAWMWIRNPDGGRWRALFASYAEALAMRDSVRCRDLMRSQWYQWTYQPTWTFSKDQDEKGLFMNSEKGIRQALGVTGKGTGYRGDCIVCLFPDTKIATDAGEIAIDKIVDGRLPVRVLTFDHRSGSTRYQQIEAFESSRGRPSVRVLYSNGISTKLTEDHLVFVSGRGYTKASHLQAGDLVLDRLRQDEQRAEQSDFALPQLPRNGSRHSGAAEKSPRVFVQSIERIPTPERVFNIRVSGDHNYFADGVLVHNCDDPLNAIDAYSDAALEFHINWWDLAMSSRLNDMKNGAKVIIMQRLSDRDLSGHVLRAGGYEHLKLPTRFEVDEINRSTIGFRDKRKVAGELLFPAMFPQEVVVQAERDMGSAGFAGQHQQRPMPAGGGMLKKHWWRYWEPKGARLPPVAVKMPDGSIDMRKPVELPAHFDQTVQSWDMAFKDTKTSDYVVGIVMSALGGDRYMRDLVRDRMDLPRTLLEVRQLSGRWPEAMLKLVEDKANGPAVVQSLRHEIGGFIEVNPEGGKVSRAAAASPQLESGNWFLPHPKIAPWVDAFITECAAFPAGVNDDQVDAWSQGANRLLPLIGKRPVAKVPQDRPRGERSWMA